MADWLWFTRLHRATYRATGGRIGGRLAGLPMLLLTSTGRKSGQPRTNPLPYFETGGTWIVVGSNNGGPRDPHWWLNLREQPRAEVQVMRRQTAVLARLVTGDERARLWPQLVAFNPPFAKYQQRTEREIPVVALEPLANETGAP